MPGANPTVPGLEEQGNMHLVILGTIMLTLFFTQNVTMIYVST